MAWVDPWLTRVSWEAVKIHSPPLNLSSERVQAYRLWKYRLLKQMWVILCGVFLSSPSLWWILIRREQVEVPSVNVVIIQAYILSLLAVCLSAYLFSLSLWFLCKMGNSCTYPVVLSRTGWKCMEVKSESYCRFGVSVTHFPEAGWL